MNIDWFNLLNAKLYGLRSPSAQIARFLPVAVEKNGLSLGIDPSLLMRKILPNRVVNACELAPLRSSPTATYNLPSAPKPRFPPWCQPNGPVDSSMSKITVSLAGSATLAPATNRLTRL